MKKKYYCTNCKFSFESEREPKTCPNCDKDTIYMTMHDEEMITDIDDLLK